jgi:hypothetical protein
MHRCGRAANVAVDDDIDVGKVRSGQQPEWRWEKLELLPDLVVRFAPIASEFQRFAVGPGVMVTRSTSATLG